jgi:hypothetical protein
MATPDDDDEPDPATEREIFEDGVSGLPLANYNAVVDGVIDLSRRTTTRSSPEAC